MKILNLFDELHKLEDVCQLKTDDIKLVTVFVLDDSTQGWRIATSDTTVIDTGKVYVFSGVDNNKQHITKYLNAEGFQQIDIVNILGGQTNE